MSKMFLLVGYVRMVFGGYFIRLMFVMVMLMLIKIVSMVICDVGLMKGGGFVDWLFLWKILVIWLVLIRMVV